MFWYTIFVGSRVSFFLCCNQFLSLFISHGGFSLGEVFEVPAARMKNVEGRASLFSVEATGDGPRSTLT